MIVGEARKFLAVSKAENEVDSATPHAGLSCFEAEQALSREKIRNQVYRRLIDKHEEAINSVEEKSIPELKTLVNPLDKTVVDKKSEFFAGIKGEALEWSYDFERDFPAFAVKAFEFVSSLKPVHAELSVSYWLSSKEMVDLGAGDALDKCVFLCSLLVSAGCKSARVRVIALEGALKHSAVLFEFAGKNYLFDPSSLELEAACEADSVDALFEEYRFDSKRVVRQLYEFNDAGFEEFE